MLVLRSLPPSHDVLAPGSDANAASSGLDAFVRTYRCPLLAALEAIHAHPMTPLDRFITLSVDAHQRYVQCLFLDNDRQILCEASSGFHGPRPRLKLSSAQRQAIAAQGFSMEGRTGNFWFARPVADRSDLWAITDVMLETLYRGYGARLGRPIGMKAPFVPGTVLPLGDSSCVPTS